MIVLLEEYRVKLINKILCAGSQEDVKQVIDEAVKPPDGNRFNCETIAGFIRMILKDLELFNPLKKRCAAMA